MPRRSQPSRGEYKPGKSLRSSKLESSPDQGRVLAVFVSCCILSDYGVYLKRNLTTGSVRLKIYDQDETYEDSLMASEDWTELLLGFASELGFEELFEASERSWRPRGTERPAEARRTLKPTPTPTADLPVDLGAS